MHYLDFAFYQIDAHRAQIMIVKPTNNHFTIALLQNQNIKQKTLIKVVPEETEEKCHPSPRRDGARRG